MAWLRRSCYWTLRDLVADKRSLYPFHAFGGVPALARELRATGIHVTTHVADLEDAAVPPRLVHEALAAHGPFPRWFFVTASLLIPACSTPHWTAGTATSP